MINVHRTVQCTYIAKKRQRRQISERGKMQKGFYTYFKNLHTCNISIKERFTYKKMLFLSKQTIPVLINKLTLNSTLSPDKFVSYFDLDC